MTTRKKKELDVPGFVPMPIQKIKWEEPHKEESNSTDMKQIYTNIMFGISIAVMIASLALLLVILYTLGVSL